MAENSVSKLMHSGTDVNSSGMLFDENILKSELNRNTILQITTSHCYYTHDEKDLYGKAKM